MIGQVAGFILEIIHMIWFWSSPKDTLSIEVDIKLMIHQDPASAKSKKKKTHYFIQVIESFSMFFL